MSSILNKIIEYKKKEIKENKSKYNINDKFIKETSAFKLSKLLKKKQKNIIAELKFASPSLGQISNKKDYDDILKSYIKNGAIGLSILTEENYFKGSYKYLIKARSLFSKIPILMKDFIISEIQIPYAKYIGASAILLIVSILEKNKLKNFIKLAKNYNLETIVEVHSKEEIEIAKGLDGDIIGVNNRDLYNMNTDIKNSLNLSNLICDKDIFISESGIKSKSHIEKLIKAGYRGFLIGSHLMKDNNPGKCLSELLRI